VPDTGGRPIAEVGLEISGASGSGTVLLDYLTWDGTPTVTLTRPENTGNAGDAWRRAWVNAADHFDAGRLWDGNVYKIIQDEGTGLLLHGEAATWADYTITTTAYPHLADAIGIVANARGLFRHVALTLSPDNKARLVETHDATATVLAEAPITWQLDRTYQLSLTTKADGSLLATIDGGPPLVARVAPDRARGAIGLLVREGHGQFGPVSIHPAEG
jgi:hypothetical protein